MDIVLKIADDWVLDKVWATIWPAAPRSVLRGAASLASKAAAASPTARTAFNNLTGGVPFANPWTAGNPADFEAIQKLSALPRDHILRQCISLYVITYVGIFLLYFSFATASYYFFFNKEMEKHPRFLKNQVKLEIQSSLNAFWALDFLTLPWFVAEVRGHSLIYENISDYGIPYAIFSVIFFLVFTDFCIYWVHRTEHHPMLYKHIHKPHHKWLVPTPFASHAFHPLDGYAQSLPYHIFVFLFPLHRWVYIGLFVFVNCWSILIHDSDMICNSPLEKVINGPSHHTLHHLYFNVNYGQYFTGCDRMGGSYRAPKAEDDPLLAVTGSGEKTAKKTQ